jgi:hypothetical protein
MSFNYALSAAQQTPTSESKPILCKSFKIDIAAGSGFTTATTYDLGWLPKDAQPIGGFIAIPTAVSGGTVSAATLMVQLNSTNFFSAINVYTTGSTTSNGLHLYMNAGQNASTDQKVTYTPTLTGAGATAGIVYINIFYVV